MAQKSKSSENMQDKLNMLYKELSRLNTQRATKTALENPGNVGKIKRDIARILTQMNMQKKLQEVKER